MLNVVNFLFELLPPFGLTVKDGLAAVDVLHSRPLHVAVELIIRNQLAVPRCLDCFLMYHNYFDLNSLLNQARLRLTPL